MTNRLISCFSLLWLVASYGQSWSEQVTDGWKPCEGKVHTAKAGPRGNECLAAEGNGDDSSYWRNEKIKLEPHRLYSVRFLARAEGAGGCAITGTDRTNRDFQPTGEWKELSFAFHTPEDAPDVFLRFGQWHWSGKVFFDQVRLFPLFAAHLHRGEIELGENELIQDGVYKFCSRFDTYASNYSRPLLTNRGSFNSNRWVFYSGGEVVYWHSIAGHPQQDAQVTFNVNYWTAGQLKVEASKDNSQWLELGELGKTGNFAFDLPAALFPADKVYVRLAAEKDCALQVDSYQYGAKLSGSPPDVVGGTLYWEVQQEARSLEVSDIRLTVADNEGVILTGVVTNVSNFPQEVSAKQESEGETKEEKPVPYKFTMRAKGSVRFNLPLRRTSKAVQKVVLTVGAEKSNSFIAAADVRVPFIEATDYGLALEGQPPQLGLWWCESGWKVGRIRPAPKETSQAIELSAARGEYEAMQVVLRPQQDTQLLSAKITDLQCADSASKVFKGENISVREVAYVRVTRPTDALGTPGDYPDPLPPLQPPLALRANCNQPLWVTVYVPYGTAAGTYSGTIVFETGLGEARVPLKLIVYDFDMPRETHLRSGFGIDTGTLEKYHKPQNEEQKRELWDKYMQNFKEHRLCPYNFYTHSDYSVRFDGEGEARNVLIDFDKFDKAASRYLDEFGFNSFVVPVQGMPWGRHPNFTKGQFGGFEQGSPGYERLWTEYMRRMESHFKERGWLKKAYVYWFDEPEVNDYEFVIAGFDQIGKAAPGITRMLTEQPEKQLVGHVDLWCPLTPNISREVVAERRKADDEVWWYVCCGPHEPHVGLFIDHPGTEMRVWLWQTWQAGVQGILIWTTTWWHNSLAYPDNLQNPWEDPMSYAWIDGVSPGVRAFWGNGDGRFFYPPRRDPNTATTPAIETPIPSIRWECLRDGVEDYEYFWLLRELTEAAKKDGKPRELIEEARRLLEVPPEVSKSMTEFTHDPRPLLAHREKVARMIERLPR